MLLCCLLFLLGGCAAGLPNRAEPRGPTFYLDAFTPVGWYRPKRYEPELYDWGAYTESLYVRFVGKDPQATRAAIKNIIDVADRSSRRPPPGVSADYGFLLQEAGDAAGAMASFQREATEYPESEPLMRKLIARIQQQARGPVSQERR